MIDDLSTLDLPELKEQLEGALADKANATSYEKRIKEEILFRHRGMIAEALAEKDEPFGTVNLGNIKFNVPKKVEWDQTLLANLYKEIGDTANEYMEVAYKVKEAAFKNWPSSIQNAFLPARTVKPGNTTIEFTEK